MAEIDEQKTSIATLLVGLYVKKTYFRITKAKSGVFFPVQDQIADQIRAVLVEGMGPQDAHRALNEAMVLARNAILKAMQQVKFNPGTKSHAEFCKALTDPIHQGEIETLRKWMKSASDKALANAMTSATQSAPAAIDVPVAAVEADIVLSPAQAKPPPAANADYRSAARPPFAREAFSNGDRPVQDTRESKVPTLESVPTELVEADRIATAKPALPVAQTLAPRSRCPQGHSRQVQAAEVFASALRRPTDAEKLAFPVTVFEWDSAHPRVPAVDQSYRFNVGDLRALLWAMENGYHSALTGPPGCGKTSLTREIAARLGRPWYRIPLQGSVGARDLLGGFRQVSPKFGPGTQWFDGLLIQAIQQPAIIDLGEIDRVDPDLQCIVHQVCNGNGITLLEDEGRFVPLHQDVALIATFNTKRCADSPDGSQPTTAVPRPTSDSFTVWLDMDYANADEEAQVLVERGVINVPSEVADIGKLANMIRSAYKRGEIQTTCSFRRLEATARLSVVTGNECEAVRHILYRRAAMAGDAKAVDDLARQVYGAAWQPDGS